MKSKILLSLLIVLTIVSYSFGQVTTVGDTTWITGGTLAGGENAGLLETTINGDVDGSGARVNPNRVYALYEGQVYYQLAPIDVNNPTGTLTIVGVPDKAHPANKTKPIIVIFPTNGQDVIINVGAVNQVYGSIKMVNVHYQTMQMDGYQNNELFYCGTANKLPQSLTIDNCLFEFSNIDLFDCTNESGAIGGWPYGAKFKITNSYFRNLMYAGQWWGSRIFQCKHPIDTLWVENCTITTGGLTFLQQNNIADFVYINHNTIVNNKKYWMLSPYRHWQYITNNIFINQNWVGEDFNVTNSGQDPDKIYMSTIDIDTNNTSQGETVQPKYWLNGDSTKFVPDLDFNHMKVYISNNINYYDPQLINGYYKSATYINPTVGTPPSYLNWAGQGSGPWPIGNQPGMWMNDRTQAVFDQYKPNTGSVAAGCGFVEENTITDNPQTVTPAIADASVVDAMAGWDQNQWGDPNFATAPAITSTKYIYGDYLPTTLPGIVNGAKSDAVTAEGAGIQVGITKFTDLSESFKQTAHISKLDNLPIGALMWDDAQNASYNSKTAFQAVMTGYNKATDVKVISTGIPETYTLAQNYPNPFNPTTAINFSIPKAGSVTLIVYNMLGQKVRTLVNGDLNAGHMSVTWDGKDSNGFAVSSGIYFYQLHAGDFTATHKMILMK